MKGDGALTRMAVLDLLGQRGPASRATIARELDLSPPAVTQVIRRLIQQGILQPLEYEPSGGGRPGQLLGLVSTAGRAIGVKLAADHLVLVDVHLDGQVVSTRTESYDALADDAIERLIARIRSFAKTRNDGLLGIGIGVPGVVERPDFGDVGPRLCSAGRPCRLVATCGRLSGFLFSSRTTSRPLLSRNVSTGGGVLAAASS